jgi:hypothetical protein
LFLFFVSEIALRTHDRIKTYNKNDLESLTDHQIERNTDLYVDQFKVIFNLQRRLQAHAYAKLMGYVTPKETSSNKKRKGIAVSTTPNDQATNTKQKKVPRRRHINLMDNDDAQSSGLDADNSSSGSSTSK